jgi:hypothetical protein
MKMKFEACLTRMFMALLILTVAPLFMRLLHLRTACHVDCLQETKIESVHSFTVTYLGGHSLKGFAQCQAIGTRGGILLRCTDNEFAVDHLQIWCSIVYWPWCDRLSPMSIT